MPDMNDYHAFKSTSGGSGGSSGGLWQMALRIITRK